jgi:hypothetical protein
MGGGRPETAFGLWRWRDVERREAHRRWRRRRRVSRRKEEARDERRSKPLALDQTVTNHGLQTVTRKAQEAQLGPYKRNIQSKALVTIFPRGP